LGENLNLFIPETVQTGDGSHPEISFPIFKHGSIEITAEAHASIHSGHLRAANTKQAGG
jgi:hypothetical protein